MKIRTTSNSRLLCSSEYLITKDEREQQARRTKEEIIKDLTLALLVIEIGSKVFCKPTTTLSEKAIQQISCIDLQVDFVY